MTSVHELAVLLSGKDQASSVFGHVTQSARGMGSALGSVASMAGGFVLGSALTQMPGILFDAAKAAAEDAASVAKLKTAVENTGASWDKYNASLNQTINAGIKKGFSDSQTRDALALMTAQTGSAEEAQKRLALAQDLSRGAGIDLGTASKLLGKVTEENVNVLGRYGLAVEKGTSQTELFAKIQEKFGGQADAFADSTAGKMEAFNLAMGELQESLGGVVLPLLTAMADILTEYVLPAVEDHVVPAFEAMGETIASALEAVMPLFFALLDAIEPVFRVLEDGWQSFSQIASDAIATVRQVFDQDWVSSDEIEPFTNAMGNAATVMRDVVMPAITETVSWLLAQFGEAVAWTEANWPLIADVVERVMAIIQAVVETATTLIRGIWVVHGEEITAAVTQTWNGIKVILGGAFTVILGVVQGFLAVLQGDWKAAWDSQATVLRGAIQIIDGITQVGIGGMVRSWLEGGLNMGRALINGIREALGNLGSMLQNIVSQAVRGLNFGPLRIDGGSIRLPGFAGGGVVPGPLGAPMLAVVHGGETVTPPGRGGFGGQIVFNFHGPVYGAQDIRDVVMQATSDLVRQGRINPSVIRVGG